MRRQLEKDEAPDEIWVWYSVYQDDMDDVCVEDILFKNEIENEKNNIVRYVKA